MLSGQTTESKQVVEMDIKLAYNAGEIVIHLPDDVSVTEYSPKLAPREVDLSTFRRGLSDAGGEELLASNSLLFVVNDGHRNTPTPRILSLLDQINPTVLDRASFVVACGTHEPPTEQHYLKIFGDHRERVEPRVRIHDCRDYSTMTKIGRDHFGEEVWLDSVLFEYDEVVMISSAEPHYFAGMTGGRKSLVPGLTDFATVERNHNQAISLDAAPLRLKGNPVAEHMASVLDMMGARKFFGIQAVIDASKKMAAVFFGDLKTSFESAYEYSCAMYANRVDSYYDTVICEMLPPLDNNLYQLQKALENCQRAVKDGGRIILVSSCAGGIGSENFYRLADNWDREKNEPKDGVIRFGSHKLSRVNAMQRRIDVRVYSTLPDDTVRHVFYEPLHSPDECFASINVAEHKIAVVRDAGHTVLTT
ncbi:MAG: lactate racemase domain-containing protein [Candidatus Zixiibacteriota bacterium]